MSTWLADGLILLAGVAIGATSIGGVLVVPVLSALGGVPVPQAIAAASLAFLPTGLLGWWGVRRGPPDGGAPRPASQWPLHMTALIGALAGAAAVHTVPADVVRAGIALLAAASGFHGLYGGFHPQTAWPRGAAVRGMPGPGFQSGLGLAVGFGSATSGTGGPVLLLPLLTLCRVPAAPAVTAAMAVQLPVAVAASAAHLVAGHLPLALGIQTGATLLAGAWAGRRLARRLPARTLRIGMSLCLIAVAVWYGLISRSV